MTGENLKDENVCAIPENWLVARVAVNSRNIIELKLRKKLESNEIRVPNHVYHVGELTKLCLEHNLVNKDQADLIMSVNLCCNRIIYDTYDLKDPDIEDRIKE